MNHIRMNPKSLEFSCAHCGVIEHVNLMLTSRLQDQIGTFNAAHSECQKPVFQPGDRVSFCGEEATVIENHGDGGIVEVKGEGRMNWLWRFQGEHVMPVRETAQ